MLFRCGVDSRGRVCVELMEHEGRASWTIRYTAPVSSFSLLFLCHSLSEQRKVMRHESNHLRLAATHVHRCIDPVRDCLLRNDEHARDTAAIDRGAPTEVDALQRVFQVRVLSWCMRCGALPCCPVVWWHIFAVVLSLETWHLTHFSCRRTETQPKLAADGPCAPVMERRIAGNNL